MKYSIKDFWSKALSSIKPQHASKQLAGWDYSSKPSNSFLEANLSLRRDVGDLEQNVWLIAAPGAVGKSTLAREICAATNAIYLDLSSASTVAGNYLVGGLVNAGLWSAWQKEETTLLIDALDEARLRVTQSSFEDFLLDVVNVACHRKTPIILLGRVGIIEEAWTILNEKSSLNPPIFDIKIFDTEQSKEFVLLTLKRLAISKDKNSNKNFYPHLESALNDHLSTYREAIQLLVDDLSKSTSTEGQYFAGYAPVLEAIATVIASETNPAKVGEATRALLQGQVLGRVTSEIMIRESGKLTNQVLASMPGLNTKNLYGPQEQLSRLCCRVLGVGSPQLPLDLPQHAISVYEDAVQSLLPQHPFLDGSSQKASSIVFAAAIVASALNSDDLSVAQSVEKIYSSEPNTSNPFLLEFYRQELSSKKKIPASHVGILYASLEATTGAGDIVRLSAEGEDHLDVEMTLISAMGFEKTYNFSTATGGTLKFGRRLSGVNVDSESTDIEIGTGGQLEIVAPVSLKARSLIFNCVEIVVKSEHNSTIDQTVVFESNEALADHNLRPPLVRPGTKLQVSWKGARTYPWTPFSFEGNEDPDTRMAEAQRALRRLCISFRSHSKGRLARYRGKVEHFRMTKGIFGKMLREQLLKDHVLSLEGEMYFLDPDILGKELGIGFQDVKVKRYSQKSKDYLQKILDQLPN